MFSRDALTRRKVLRDSGGITVSIPDLLVSTAVRIIVVGGLVGIIGAMLYLSASTKASTSSSSALQAATLLFKSTSSTADVVRGSTDSATNTQAVSFMTTASGKCDIETWRNVNVNGELSLVTEKSTAAGACTMSTAIPAPSAANRHVLLAPVAKSVITYTNVAGRVITFGATGAVHGATGSAPAGVLAEDWNDLRPQHIKLNVNAKAAKLTTFAKNASLTGVTSVVNFVQAPNGVKYIAPTNPSPQGAATTDLKVERSTTTGAWYAGTHEGVKVSFMGGQCKVADGSLSPSIVSIRWIGESPSGLADSYTDFTEKLTSPITSRHLDRVPNGATGRVTISVKCAASDTAVTKTISYTQEVPDTSLTVTAGSDAEHHNLNWSAVSSLPTSFKVERKSNNGVLSNDYRSLGSTADLNYTSAQAQGVTYGFDTDFRVTPTVNGKVGNGATGSIGNVWPATDKAHTMTYTRTGANGNYSNGTLRWTNPTSCPAGTSVQARKVDTMSSTGNFHYSGGTGWWTDAQRVFADGSFGAWAKDKTAEAWAPGNAQQGWLYGAAVETRCYSTATKASSAEVRSDRIEFVTEMARPSTSKWDGYNYGYHRLPNGGTTGYTTCRNHGGSICNTQPYSGSMMVDYTTYCAAGSNLSWSTVSSRSWSNDYFTAWFHTDDGWELPDPTRKDPVNSRTVDYGSATYACSTPFSWSPRSNYSTDFVWTVNKKPW